MGWAHSSWLVFSLFHLPIFYWCFHSLSLFVFPDDRQHSQLLRSRTQNCRHRAHLQPAGAHLQPHAVDFGGRLYNGAAHGRFPRHVWRTHEKGKKKKLVVYFGLTLVGVDWQRQTAVPACWAGHWKQKSDVISLGRQVLLSQTDYSTNIIKSSMLPRRWWPKSMLVCSQFLSRQSRSF